MQDNKQIILALDTTASPLLAALCVGDKIYSASKKGIKQEELLFPLIHKLLAKAGVEFKDINKVFFIRGPGRFTGIRIGLTLADMLKTLRGARAGAATMFEVLHRAARDSAEYKRWLNKNAGGAHAVVLHSFREEYFLQIFGVSAPQWLSKEELLHTLKESKTPLFVTGFDAERGPLGFLHNISPRVILGAPGLSKITAGLLRATALDADYETAELEPLYLKPARFERNENKKSA